MTAFDVVALGVRVRIEAPDADTEALREAWAECAVTENGDEPQAVVRADQVPPDASAEVVAERLTQLVTLAAVGARAGELLMLHACAVAHPQTGDALVLVGQSGVGKTTLAATLGRRWAYLTDETAAVRQDGSLLPYPKPLSVVSTRHPGKDQRSPGELGLLPAGEGPFRVRGVWLLDRCPGVEASWEPVRTVPAVALLAEHTSYLGALDHPLHRIAGLVRSAGGLRRVRYAEAAELLPMVAEVLGSGGTVDVRAADPAGVDR